MLALIYLAMIFCHIVDDYYLQGCLAEMKQRDWWKRKSTKRLYECDYIAALIAHAFSWSFMIHVPIFAYALYSGSLFKVHSAIIFLTIIINTFVHAYIDNAKCNQYKINLIRDQLLHLLQISITFAFWTMVLMFWING